MRTIFTHPAVALTRSWFPSVPRRAVVAAALGSILPDVDVTAFALGIPYEHMFGHRGLTHSIAFALLYSVIAALVLRVRVPFIFLGTVSHTLLDACTDGGLGVALFAPFSTHRYFFPGPPSASPPSEPASSAPRGMETIVSELLWVWAPCVALGLIGKYVTQVQHKPGK
jgi:inner membrane protein